MPVSIPRSSRCARRSVVCLSVLAGALLYAACSASPANSAAADSAQAELVEVDSSAIEPFDSSSVTHVVDSARAAAPPHITGAPRLSALADTLADLIVFRARTQRLFVAATRAKRLLLDIGRVDAPLKSPERLRAFEEAVRALSPVRVGDRFRLRGPWGEDDAHVTGYAQWNGRVVATLAVPPRVDSLARSKMSPVALALVADSAEEPTTTTCARDSVPAPLVLRLPEVRDSLTAVLQADTARLTARLRKSLRATRTEAVGCFGTARVMMFVGQSAGDYEYYHELAVLVDTTGTVTPLHVSDLRFKVHEALGALDADGDSVDDIAVRGHAPRIGGTVILRLDPAKKRLDYVAGGFAWESF